MENADCRKRSAGCGKVALAASARVAKGKNAWACAVNPGTGLLRLVLRGPSRNPWWKDALNTRPKLSKRGSFVRFRSPSFGLFAFARLFIGKYFFRTAIRKNADRIGK